MISSDGDRWTRVKPNVDTYLNGVASNESRFVAVGSGPILYSSDGDRWRKAASPGISPETLNDVTWDGARFMAVGRSGLIASSRAIVGRDGDRRLADAARGCVPRQPHGGRR